MRAAFFAAASLALAWCWYFSDQPFFWDTIQLGSRHAHFFYENSLAWAPLPPDIDSGHPPLLGYYLAVCWSFFGKTLLVSHLAMWPFITGILFLLYRIGRFWLQGQGAWLLVFSLADPVILTQMSLISPDTLLFFFLLCWVHGWQEKRSWLQTLALAGLCTVSMRGMMSAAALGVFFLWEEHKVLKIKSLYPFIPGVLLGAGFLYWHWQATGWIGHHPGSSWAPAFERTDLAGVGHNVLVLGWRWLDLGRAGEWLLLGYLIGRGGWRIFQHPATRLWLVLCVVLFPSALLYHNLSAHRYFIPCFWVFHAVVLCAWHRWPATEKRWWAAGVAALLLSGHGWIPPKGVSMDWDCTLMYAAYADMQARALQVLDENEIAYSATGSYFPNLATGELRRLDGDQRQLASFDFSKNTCIFATNVCNDFSAEELQFLHEHCQQLYFERRYGIWISLYRKK
jgi:hypothetical protein